MPSYPRTRAGVVVVEQVVRGEAHFVVKDPDTKKYFRMRPAEARVLRAFDGSRTPAEIARALAAEGLSVSEAAVERFAGTCSRLGLLERTLAERSTMQLERLRAERNRRRSLFRGELLRMRWSMGDPDRWMGRLMPWLAWCFTPAFLAGSVVAMAMYVGILVSSWPAFSHAVASLVSLGDLTLTRAVLVWVVTLTVVLLHELGHGFACKYFGGEVHELGFMLVYFQPAFYCNVNDAWSFPERHARLWVTAAGSWVQLLIASLAALTWWVARPDTLISQAALVAMVVGGMTTVLANANPLLPLDGYFALSDWLEIPNLRHRAIAHFGWWVRRHLTGLDAPEPPASARERRVFLIYGALASVYVTLVLAATAMFVIRVGWRVWGLFGALMVIGVIAVMSRQKAMNWGRTAWKALRARLDRMRRSVPGGRRGLAIAGAAATVVVLAAVIPWPITATGVFRAASAHGVVVDTPEGGVVREVLVREGETVGAGAPLLRLSDPRALQELMADEHDVDSLGDSATRALATGDAGSAGQMDAAEASASTRAAAARRHIGALTVRALAAGEVVTPRPEALVGRHVAPGEAVLILGDPDSLELRIILRGPGAAAVQPGQTVHVVSYANVARPVEARVLTVAAAGRAVPAGDVEIRARLPQGDAWRLGVTGEARVELARSTVLGALWWSVRARLRSDLFL